MIDHKELIERLEEAAENVADKSWFYDSYGTVFCGVEECEPRPILRAFEYVGGDTAVNPDDLRWVGLACPENILLLADSLAAAVERADEAERALEKIKYVVRHGGLTDAEKMEDIRNICAALAGKEKADD